MEVSFLEEGWEALLVFGGHVEADEEDFDWAGGVFAADGVKVGHLLYAWPAPCGPEVDDVEGVCACGGTLLKLVQGDFWRGLGCESLSCG